MQFQVPEKSLHGIFPDPVTSENPAAFRHTLEDIHERIKLFVLVKTRQLEGPT